MFFVHLAVVLFFVTSVQMYQNFPPQTSTLTIKESKECKGSVQLAMLVDVTGSYKDYITELRKVISKLTTSLKDKYPGSEFALGSFADWPNSQALDDYCYRLDQSFTTDNDQLVKAANRLQGKYGGDGPETSLNALLYTATDPALKWKTEKLVMDIPQHKMILIATDNEWKSTDDSHRDNGGPPPKGDGKDDCSNGKPSVQLVKSVLEKKDIYVTAVISVNYGMKHWLNYTTFYNFDPKKWNVREQKGDTADEIFKDISMAVDDVLCPPKCDNPWTYDFDFEW